MDLIELFLIAVGLSMDAFAVSVCKGLAMPKCTFKKAAIVGLWFGGFQALMPGNWLYFRSAVPGSHCFYRSLDRICITCADWWKYDSRSIGQ